MAQNRHNAIIHLGHQNGMFLAVFLLWLTFCPSCVGADFAMVIALDAAGTVTLWSPNLSTPHVKLLAHTGPIQSISIDPSASSCGRYMATSGADGRVKVWDNRNWGKTVREWSVRSAGRHQVDWSGKGLLAVAGKGGVSVRVGRKRGIGGSPPLNLLRNRSTAIYTRPQQNRHRPTSPSRFRD